MPPIQPGSPFALDGKRWLTPILRVPFCSWAAIVRRPT
jgi:hypothetical protein